MMKYDTTHYATKMSQSQECDRTMTGVRHNQNKAITGVRHEAITGMNLYDGNNKSSDNTNNEADKTNEEDNIHKTDNFNDEANISIEEE